MSAWNLAANTWASFNALSARLVALNSSIPANAAASAAACTSARRNCWCPTSTAKAAAPMNTVMSRTDRMSVKPFRLDNSTRKLFHWLPRGTPSAFGERAALTMPPQYRPLAHASPGARAFLFRYRSRRTEPWRPQSVIRGRGERSLTPAKLCPGGSTTMSQFAAGRHKTRRWPTLALHPRPCETRGSRPDPDRITPP